MATSRRALAALSLSLSLPMRSALQLSARGTRRRVPLVRLCATDAAAAAPPKAAQDFLVRNDRNDVQVLSCPTLPVLEQGLLELGTEPHICVAGESNAGKSSLLNHMLRKANLARASSRAGKTTAVDLMLVNQQLVLADLPGLPSRDHQVAYSWEKSWRPLVLEYVRRCEALRAMLYVHDVRWKVSAQCRDFVADVRAMGVPVLLVLTKDDKLQGIDGADMHRQRSVAARRVKASLDLTDSVHLHYSVDSSLPSSRKGRRQLLRYVESLVATDGRDGAAELLEGIAAKKRAGAAAGAGKAVAEDGSP